MFEWTGVNEQVLRDLWGEYSSSYIAGVIGAPSRNSVLGKAHRLGLSEKRSGTPKSRSTPFRKPRVQRFREVPPSRFAEDTVRVEPMQCEHIFDWMKHISPAPQGCSLMDLTHETCRFPLWGDVVSDQYCGAKPLEGLPYCGAHTRISYQPRRRG
jgi:GcrA cell cycle regulator